jgi:hypothetical protein
VVPTVAGTAVTPSVTKGEDAAWTVTITNRDGAPLTNVTARLLASANGGAPLPFDTARMPGCVSDTGNSALCTVPSIGVGSSTQFVAYAKSTGLGNGATVSGRVTVSSTGVGDGSGALGSVGILGCGNACVTAVGAPGDVVASTPGSPTLTNPTKQIVTLPPRQPGAAPIAITVNSLNPGASQPVIDKDLCPSTGTHKCSGQISVIAGNFSKYVSRANPVKVQIVARWAKKVPPGRLLMQKLFGPPIQLAPCVVNRGLYNTPCTQPEIVIGSAANHNLMTISTILFVGSDPHIARRASNVPDAPTAVKAVAGKKSATISWKPPIVTNGRLTGYMVTPLIGKVAQTPVSFPATAKNGVVKGLTTGKPYVFVVVAKNQHGLSLRSLPSKVIKPK